ncbi:MAG: TlpA family protein disulfide reductase [Candidatus Heimdallarchaeaceae archaeon]
MRTTKKIWLCLFVALLLLNKGVRASSNNTSIPFIDLSYMDDDVNNYEGVRIVLFFSPECPHCSDQTEELKKLESDYNLTFFALSVIYNSTNTILINYKESHDLSSAWIMGFALNESFIEFQIRVVPFTIILDDYGFIVSVIEGYASVQTIIEKVEIAIEHKTDLYDTKPMQDNTDLLKVLFIVIGAGITVVVIYFVVLNLKEYAKLKKLEKKVK